MNGNSVVHQPAMKVVSVWVAWLASVGVNSWTDVAAMLAALYSVLLIVEWLWKRAKWGKRRDRRADDC